MSKDKERYLFVKKQQWRPSEILPTLLGCHQEFMQDNQRGGALDSKSSSPFGECGFDSLLRHACYPRGISTLAVILDFPDFHS
jgi:hypothetical protein